MKKILSSSILLMTILCVCVLGAFTASAGEGGSDDFPYYQSCEDVTVEKICEFVTPANILKNIDGFRIDMSVSGTSDDNLTSGSFYTSYSKSGDIIFCNQYADYPDGYYNHLYFSTDPEDVNLYVATNNSSEKQPASADKLNIALNTSLFEYELFDDVKIVSASEENGLYHISIECTVDGELYFTDELTVDPQTGFVLSAETTYYNAAVPEDSITQTITYSNDICADTTPKDEYMKSHEE